MQAGAAHAKTEWKRKMTAGVKCKKRLCISDFCICVEVQAIFYKKGMIGQKYVSKIFFSKCGFCMISLEGDLDFLPI